MYGPSPKTHENYTTTVKWSTSAIGRFWPTSRGSKNGHGLHQFVRSQVAKDDLTYWVHRSVPWFCGFRAWAATSAAWGRRNITASLVLDDNLSLTRGYSRDIYIIIIISISIIIIIIIIYIYIDIQLPLGTGWTWYRIEREGLMQAANQRIWTVFPWTVADWLLDLKIFWASSWFHGTSEDCCWFGVRLISHTFCGSSSASLVAGLQMADDGPMGQFWSLLKGTYWCLVGNEGMIHNNYE